MKARAAKKQLQTSNTLLVQCLDEVVFIFTKMPPLSRFSNVHFGSKLHWPGASDPPRSVATRKRSAPPDRCPKGSRENVSSTLSCPATRHHISGAMLVLSEKHELPFSYHELTAFPKLFRIFLPGKHLIASDLCWMVRKSKVCGKSFKKRLLSAGHTIFDA